MRAFPALLALFCAGAMAMAAPSAFRRRGSTDDHTPKVVSVDIPDPDNFMMVQGVLHSFPDEHISIVLTGRSVSFDHAPYGSFFGALSSAIQQALSVPAFPDAVRKMLTAVRPADAAAGGWVRRLPAETQAWFAPDAGYGDSARVRAASDLYLRHAVVRLTDYLRRHGHAPARFAVYAEPAHVARVAVAMRHAVHHRDWAYAFDPAEKAVLADVDRAFHQPVSTDRGDGIYKLVEENLGRLKKELEGKGYATTAKSFDDLVAALQHQKPLWLVGGPFTEYVLFLRKAAVKAVIGMGGFITGGLNIFPNQFNFLADMSAAQEMLAAAASVPTFLVPTEVCKDSAWQLGRADVRDLLSQSPSTISLIEQYYKIDVSGSDATSKAVAVPVFDYVTQLVASHRDLFADVRAVESYTERNADGVDVIRFRERADGNVQMAWNSGGRNDPHQREKLGEYQRILRQTFVEKSGSS